MKSTIPMLLGAAALAVLAGSAAAASVPPPRAELRDFRCQRALDPAARSVSVTAVMRPLTGTRGMTMRFELQIRPSPGRPFATVSGHGLNDWISPTDSTLGQLPGDVWIVPHPVVNLSAATYRFHVSFRWVGSDRRVLGTAVRVSATCVQRELRPNLVLKSIAVQPVAGRPKIDRYVASIRNAGQTAAGSFAVRFSDGEDVQMLTVHGLAAHQQIKESFEGPRCAPGEVQITVDPYHQVDVSTRASATTIAACN